MRLRRPRLEPGGLRSEPLLAAGARASRALGHDFIGTEHVLLALASDSGARPADVLAGLGLTPEIIRRDIDRLLGTCVQLRRGAIDPDALATLGIDLDEVTRHVEETFGPGALDRPEGAPRRIARRLEKALELAAAEAGCGQPTAEQVLMALAAVEDCVAARILRDRGVSVAVLREAFDH